MENSKNAREKRKNSCGKSVHNFCLFFSFIHMLFSVGRIDKLI
ncbi:hypothetical protein D356_00725 [Enterococcus faecium SD2A-2]|uniref:Uncharacterized protein n=1 Tax=Enterococcus faecium SD2A-2 TaxID=1244154 RepID=A0AB73ABE9_ENTFC|nr:hypothetical protein D356_00725 [Enterococcus faecium SD2A-2]